MLHLANFSSCPALKQEEALDPPTYASLPSTAAMHGRGNQHYRQYF